MAEIYYVVAHRDQREIDSFKTRYESFDTACIPVIFNDVLNLKVVDIQRSTSWGSSHVVYFVRVVGWDRPAVFRANLGVNPVPEIVMKTEQLICQAVEKIGVPTNKVIYVDVSRNQYQFDYQIQECLIGHDIENHFKGTKEEYDKLSFELGEYIAMYSTLRFDKFGLFDSFGVQRNTLVGTKDIFSQYITTCLDQDLNFITSRNVITTAVRDQIVKLFDEYKPVINSLKEGSLVHHDLADHNIFFDSGRISGIFDWETAVVGDPVLDLASCPTWKTFFPREEQVVKGYHSIVGVNDYFRERMDIYRLRTMLWKIVYAIRMDILDDARKQRFADSLKPFKLKVAGA